jgi:molybdopterin-containing oxidoreductase family membrane subunit
MEIFSVFYSGNALEMADLLIKTSNGGLMILMSMICLNVLLPQLLWVKDVRENPIWLGLISVFVLVGMWLERYFIVILSQKGWVFTGNTSYFPSIYEIIIFAGSFGLFFGIYLLIFRFIPIIPVFESIVKIRK